MFQQIFKKIYTISNQNHHILIKKKGEINIFLCYKYKYLYKYLNESTVLRGRGPRPLLAPLVPPLILSQLDARACRRGRLCGHRRDRSDHERRKKFERGRKRLRGSRRTAEFILPALFDLYIHPLKGIFHPSHHKIYSFPALIHSLYPTLSTVGPLVTLSKYIHVRSSFEVFIETNSTV
jgi:hypothetical protein